MRTRISLPAVAAFLLLLQEPAGAHQAAPDPVPARDLVPAVDRLFARWTDGRSPGCAVKVAHGAVMLVDRAYGLANLESATRNSVDTVFEVASASKQFTAAAILLLARDGRLSLDDDIRKYLPEMPVYGRTITVGQLLNHTSGLRDWRFVLGVAGWPLGTAVTSNADALAIIMRQKGLNHLPGDEFLYTNSGYTLAAVIAERVSGQTLQQLTRERIFEPLGMASTRWREDFRTVVEGRATAYGRNAAGYFQNMPFENAYGSGGLLSTTGDITRWNRALSEGGLGADIAAALQQVGSLSDGRPTGYGRGLFIGRYRGTLEAGHGGDALGYRAWIGRYPERDLSVAILCNAGDANPAWLAHDIADLVLPAGSEPVHEELEAKGQTRVPAAPPWQPDAAELRGLAGRYRSPEVGATYLAVPRNGGLSLMLEGRPGQVFELSPTRLDTFVFLSGKVVFHRSASGRGESFSLTVERARNLLFERLDR